MELLFASFARLLVRCIQALSLRMAARVGRAAGHLAYGLDTRHRRVAVRNLTMCFGKGKSPAEIRALARENFRRIGESFACAIKTANMTIDQLRPHVEFVAEPLFTGQKADTPPPKLVAAIGHFGNFELYARFGQFVPGLKTATTYRSLRPPSIDRLFQGLREKSGCAYFERRFDAAALKAFMNQPGVLLGLLADQHGGARGLRIPFLGHECSTSAAPALFALRYSSALHTGVCYRVGLARWRIEAGPRIPTEENGQARSTRAIMLDVNRAFEEAVRKDPANWFWVHNRWKQVPPHRARSPAESPPAEPAETAL